MPGTWTSGVKRLRAWATALVIGVFAVLVTPAVAWSATMPAPQTAPGAVTLRADHGNGTAAAGASSPTSAGRLAAAVPGALPAAVRAAAQAAPAATAGAGSASGVVSGQAAVGAATDLSVDSVAAPPAVVPWIVVALVLLVITGAVKAYGRSPQRAAIRDRHPRS